MTHPPIRDRWISQPEAAGQTGRAGALLRQAVQRQPLGPTELAAIERRLSSRSDGPARMGGRRLVSQVAIALALLLAGGALSAAVLGMIGRHTRPAAAPKAPAPAPAPSANKRHSWPVSARVEAPLDDPPPSEPAPAPIARRPRIQATVPEPPAEIPTVDRVAPSRLAQESELLARALAMLRRQDDPRGALALLDEYQARFPADGVLGPEAEVTRVEALVRLGRHQQALAILDAATPVAAGAGRELLAARGELRAAAGRCGDALGDFEAVLRVERARDLPAERALHGRASCRSRTGDVAGARADLESYLARFPSGRFAAETCAILHGLDRRACP
jgi:hypothetical protein